MPGRGSAARLRRVHRSALGRCVVFVLGIILATGWSVVVEGLDPELEGLVVSGEEAATAGYKRKVTRGENGDFVVEFYHNNGSEFCSSFVLVPAENIWARALRGFLYLVALLYTFLGIAIVSDIFMASIERITAARTEARVDEDGTTHTVTVVVWNETVANLTLMALGSSAPEILMSVVETVQTLESEPGELGPSTIVGSAAFNLFVITGVCIYFAEEKPKPIKEVGVFIITSFSSIFAYFWLVFTLMIWTPNEVTIAEGLLTLSFFPLLVVIAWCQDRGWFRSGETHVEQKIVAAEVNAGQMDREQIQSLWRKMKEEGGHDVSNDDDHDAEVDRLELLLRAKEMDRHQAKAGLHVSHLSRAAYRMDAVRSITKKPAIIEKTMRRTSERRVSQKGTGTPVPENVSHDIPLERRASKSSTLTRGSITASHTPHGPLEGLLEWSSATYSVIENEGAVRLTIVRRGGHEGTVTVKAHTVAGTALPVVKYIETEETIIFEAGETRKEFKVPIVDDKQYQEDQHFFVVLDHPSGGATLGNCAKAEVTIVDDDQPGEVGFLKEAFTFPESCGIAVVPLVRRNGTDGKVAVRVRAENGTARNGEEYTYDEQVVEFAHGDSMGMVTVPIRDDTCYEKLDTFALMLFDPKGGASIGRPVAHVTITNDPGISKLIDHVMSALVDDREELKQKMTTTSWGQQFRDAVSLSDDGDLSDLDYVMHFLTIFWKVILAVIPPTELAGGWVAFVTALLFIGLIVVFVGEIASLFGCVCGLPDPVTAITFVALGTSLPDLFASKTAVEEEEYADAAIGNVTGSNSVNVFLGLGLPWVIASLYHEVKGNKYRFPSGDLGFSVIVFLTGAVVCLACLALNRNLYGGELGGPLRYVFLFFFVLLWVVYVVLSSLKSTGHL